VTADDAMTAADAVEPTPTGMPGGTRLVVIGVIDALGTGLYLACSVLFFVRVAGLSAGQVGLGLSVAGVVGLVLQPWIGRLTDTFGARRVLIGLNLTRAVGFTAYLAVHDWVGFLLVAALLGVGEQAVGGVYQAFIEQVVGTTRRVEANARIRVVFNVGCTLGALVGTLAIQSGRDTLLAIAMLANAASFVVAAVLLLFVPVLPRIESDRPTGPGAGSPGAPGAPGRRPRRLALVALRDVPYVVVGGLNSLFMLHMSILSVALPLWVSLHTDAPAAMVGVLLVVNTLLAVAGQVRVGRAAESVEGGVRAMRLAGAALAAASVLFAVSSVVHRAAGAAAVLLVAVVALTAAELWQSAAQWSLSYNLAPDDRRGEYLSTFGLGASAQFVIGPTLVTLGVVEHGVLGWSVLAAAFAGVAFAVGPAVRAARTRRTVVHACPEPSAGSSV
jgi:MFS family permease